MGPSGDGCKTRVSVGVEPTESVRSSCLLRHHASFGSGQTYAVSRIHSLQATSYVAGRGTDENIGWGGAGQSSGSMAQERKALARANHTRPSAAVQDDSRPALAGKQQQPQQIPWPQQLQQRNVQRRDCAHTVVQAVGTGRQPQAGLQQSWQAGWQGGQQQTAGGAGKWASFVGDDDE